jgi:hypothetical protein
MMNGSAGTWRRVRAFIRFPPGASVLFAGAATRFTLEIGDTALVRLSR